jgi:leucyl aminopeptidase
MKFAILEEYDAKAPGNHIWFTHKVNKDYFISKQNYFLDIKRQTKTIVASDLTIIHVENVIEDCVMPIVFSVFRHFYSFEKYKSKKSESECIFCGENLKRIATRLSCQMFGNDLATEPSNKMTPELFCLAIKKEMTKYNSPVTWLNEKMMSQAGLNLVLAVGSGSKNKPRFLISSVGNGSKTICLVGKGITFDSGGYDLKHKMLGMKCDMIGGAVVMSTLKFFAMNPDLLDKNIKLVGIVPLAENAISGKATKPGDIYTAYNGKTVEILNTDAEGRLVLADALAYACHNYDPALLLDFATLTGWSSTLNSDISFSYYTNTNKLSKLVNKCSKKVGERCIRQPNWPEYKRYTRSDIADLQNANFNCDGSSCNDGFMATMFLSNFVPKKYNQLWIHFDAVHCEIKKGLFSCSTLQTAIELCSSIKTV